MHHKSTMKKKYLYIITGSSKGLGEALVEKLLANPHNQVIGISRSEVRSKHSYTHLSIDLADTDSLVSRLEEIFPLGGFEGVILINNAGWIGEIAHNGELNPFSIKIVHQVNVIAPAMLMNAFMKKYKGFAGKKMVINISSGAADKVIDGWSGYCASKAALNQMTLVAQHESDLKNRGFRLYALAPGIIDTPMQEDIRSSSEESFSNIFKFRGYKENDELSSPEEIADKVCYLIDHHEDFKEVLQDVREF